MLWAMFPMFGLGFAVLGETHGNLVAVVMNVVPVLAIWICCAGLVAMSNDRDRENKRPS